MSRSDDTSTRDTTPAGSDSSSAHRTPSSPRTRRPDSLPRQVKRMRARFRRWRWRRRVKRRPVPPLNAWGYPDNGYW